MSESSRRGHLAFLEPFTLAGFRWTWLTVLVFNTGRYALILVGGQEAFRLTHSPVWSSLIMMFLLGPTLLFGPVAGVLADRYDRSVLMRIACLVAGLACLADALFRSMPATRLALVVAVSVVVGIASALFSPAWQAIVPSVLGDRKLLGGGAFTRIAVQGGEFIGPAIGTPILVILGPAEGFGYCAALYGLAATLTLRVPVADGRPTPEVDFGTTVGRVMEGFRYIRANRRVAGVIALTGFHCMLTMAFLGLLPGFAAGHLGNPDAYGAMVAALGLGAIVGALVLAFFSVRTATTPVLLGSAVFSGVFLVALGAADSVPTAIAAAACSGAAQAIFMATSYSATQTQTADRFRGRVASVSTMLNAGSMGVLGLGWGAIADAFAASLVLVTLGAAFIIVVVIFYFSFPALQAWNGLDEGARMIDGLPGQAIIRCRETSTPGGGVPSTFPVWFSTDTLDG
jgi:MFS family permease